MAKRKYGIVMDEVMKDPDLSLRAKGLYGLLATYADKERTCFPSTNTLAEFSGISKRTIERTLKELEKKNYIIRTDRVFTLL